MKRQTKLNGLGWGLGVVFALIGLSLISCSSSDDSAANQSGNAFYCSVSSVAIVGSTNEITFTLSASGGTPNYILSAVSLGSSSGTLAGGSTTFSSSTVPTVQFGSLSYASLPGTSGTVTITDSSSTQLSASCSFSVPTTATSGSLACSITPSLSSPSTNQVDTFTVTGSGGTAPYTFSGFSPGTYGSVVSALTATSSVQAVASALYTSAGTSTASAQITDAAGATTSCTVPVSVGSTGVGSGYLACNAIVSPNPSYRGQYVYVSAQITSYGSGNPRIFAINYPTASGMYGFFTSNLSATVSFPYPGTWPLTLVIQDSSGNTAACGQTQQVN